jgi:hypothetical protein
VGLLFRKGGCVVGALFRVTGQRRTRAPLGPRSIAWIEVACGDLLVGRVSLLSLRGNEDSWFPLSQRVKAADQLFFRFVDKRKRDARRASLVHVLLAVREGE